MKFECNFKLKFFPSFYTHLGKSITLFLNLSCNTPKKAYFCNKTE